MRNYLEDIERSEFNKFIPIFNKQSLIIDSKENYFLLLHDSKMPLKVNQTTFDILELATGKNNIAQIIASMQETYNVECKKLTMDMINVLYEFETMGYVVWKGGKSLFEKLYMYRDEKQNILYKSLKGPEIIANIRNTYDKGALVSAYVKKEIKYSYANIKSTVGSRQETFYEMRKENKLAVFISLKPLVVQRPTLTYLYYYLEYFYIDNLLVGETEFDDFVRWCVKWELDYTGVYYGESDIFLTAMIKGQDVERYSSMGFSYSGTLHKECNEVDVVAMQKKIENVFP